MPSSYCQVLDNRPNMPVARKILMQKSKKCHYCGVQCHSRDPRHKHYGTVDHRIPKSRGGTGHIDNLVLACLDCNQRKGALMPTEFPVFAAKLTQSNRWSTS